jgi:hypothetical protein
MNDQTIMTDRKRQKADGAIRPGAYVNIRNKYVS